MWHYYSIFKIRIRQPWKEWKILPDMNLYYLKQIMRSLYRKKFNSLVKIIGITFTVIPLILIWSFVSYESGYDRFLSGNDNVFRIIRNWQEDKIFGTYTSVPFLPALIKDFPEIIRNMKRA